MIIEIGKKYNVSPKYKKQYIDVEYVEHESNGTKLTITTFWRSGEFAITPMHNYEVEWLEDAMTSDEDQELCPLEFEESEFLSSWDGYFDELKVVEGEISDEEMARLNDGYCDDGYSFLEDEGYTTYNSDVYMCGELSISEFEEFSEEVV